MVAVAQPAQCLTLPLPLVGAITSGGFVALLFLAMPAGVLERAVSASGIPAILAAAEPPLGVTARIALGAVLGGVVAAFAWFGLRLSIGDRPFALDRLAGWLPRGDVHPDGPPRPPLFANRDLGTPFLEVKATDAMPRPDSLVDAPPPLEQALPANLDQPLSAFDPAAILANPMPAPERVEPLAASPAPAPAPKAVEQLAPGSVEAPTTLLRPQLIDPGDRFETFELTPLQRVAPVPRAAPPSLRLPPANSLRAIPLREDPAVVASTPGRPDPVVTPATETTVHALLARLEHGVAQRAAPAAPARGGSLHDTLSDLRRLATGAR